jgi:hypothetical protein
MFNPYTYFMAFNVMCEHAHPISKLDCEMPPRTNLLKNDKNFSNRKFVIHALVYIAIHVFDLQNLMQSSFATFLF